MEIKNCIKKINYDVARKINCGLDVRKAERVNGG